MENYRKEMDKKILEQLKDKIQIYLKSKGLKTADFIRENMDKVAGLYVENSIENGKSARMESRGNKANRPSEIMIDKGFAILDENDNPIGIDNSVKKLIMTQLTHELLHSGSRFKDNENDEKEHTGIMGKTDQNRGLNEGMTQMFTEKIWGYTVSPNADSKYKDYKKIAKILDATFGENVSLDAYFNHSTALQEACNGLSQDNKFYSDINKYLTSTYYMSKKLALKKEKADAYYNSIMKPIREKMVNLLYEKVCTQIIIPKLKTLPKEEQQTYLYDILNSVKDEPNVLKTLSNAIVKYANMSDKELQEAINGIDKDLKRTEQEKQFVLDVYNEKNCSELVIISDDGKIIKSSDDPSLVIENESLKEKILSQIYFQEKGISKDDFGNNVKNICENLQQDNDLSFDKKEQTALDRKKVFSAMKVTARENGYMILNSLEECESGNNIPLNAVELKKGENIKFQDLKSIYQKFQVDYKDDDWTQLYVKDRKTGKEITDPRVVSMAKFASIWSVAAGSKWVSGEEIPGITYAFNESSERIYNELGELVGKGMAENGTIDTQAIYDEISKDGYKHSEEMIRTLLINQGNMSIVYDFFKMQNDEAKMETRLAKSSNEFIYGLTGESIAKSEVETIMQSIPDFDSKGSRENAQEQTIGISQEQIERQQKDEEARKTTKLQVEEFKKATSEEVGKKMSGQSLKRDISQSKITTRETEQAMSDLQKRQKAKSLWNRSQREGLSQEEQRLVEENERQINQATVDYQHMQENKKRKTNGLEM